MLHMGPDLRVLVWRCRKWPTIICTRHGINDSYPEAFKRSAHSRCGLKFDNEVRRRAFGPLLTLYNESHDCVLMVETLHLELRDIRKLECRQCVVLKNHISL